MNTAQINKKLGTIDRYCGYLLFFLMFLYFVSGYGRTKQLLDPFFTKSLHEKWLPLPTIAAFLAHSLLNLRFILIRKGVRDRLWWNAYLIALGLIMFALFFYLHRS